VRFLRRLSYRPELSTLARVLGLRLLRSRGMKLYYRLAAPQGVIQVEVKGVTGKFYVSSPEELRELEGAAIGSGADWSERRILESFIGFLRHGDVVYDVGASVGLYSVLLAKAVGDHGQVVAFEPDKRSYRRLQENVRLNGLANVRAFCRALGERNGTATLYLGEEWPSCSSLVPRSDVRVAAREIVEVVEGDGYRDLENLPIPQAIKIDVEGAERDVLRGLRKTLTENACRFVCCEVHPELLSSGETPKEIMELLRSCGFGRIDVHPRGFERHVLAYKN